MAKHKIVYATSALALLSGVSTLGAVPTYADSNILESCDGVENCAVVTSTAELSSAFSDLKSTVIIGSSFDLTTDLRTGGDMSLYLNDYTITSDGWSIINTSGDLTIYAGENGKIVETGGDYAPLYVYNNTKMTGGTLETAGQAVFTYYDTGSFTMDGGMIIGGSDTATAVVVSNGAKFVMNDGTINGDTWGVSVFKDSEFVMNGGMVAAGSIGVSGNGSASGNNEGTNAKITLNSGVINSGDLGVYAPQIAGETVIGKDMTINAGACGVEVRAGNLTIDGATIEVDANAPYEFNPNGSGSTASGVGVAVAQHSTKQEISVAVSDGVITAPVAFAEANPQHNPEEDIAKVTLGITGGEFNATNGDPVVASEDLTEFITGGTYNKEVNVDLVAEGYDEYSLSDEGPYVVDLATSVELPAQIVMGIGDPYSLSGLSDEAMRYSTIDILDPEVASIDENNTITGLASGETAVHINLHNLKNPVEEFAPIYVYAIDDDEAPVRTEVNVGAVNPDEIDSEELDKINAELGEGTVAGYFDVTLTIIGEDGDTIETVAETSDAVLVQIDLPSDIPELTDGYKREYFVLRSHNGEVTKLEAWLNEDGKLEFENSLFSTFAIAYVDSKIETDEPTDEPVDEPTDEPVEEPDGSSDADSEATDATTPDTGTITAAGASAVSASIMAAIAVGIITSMMTFAFLLGRKDN